LATPKAGAKHKLLFNKLVSDRQEKFPTLFRDCTAIQPSGWLEDRKKIAQILEKVPKTVAKPKSAKISTSKLNLKVQNIFLKPPQNTYNNHT
jgi:hypothetical protein